MAYGKFKYYLLELSGLLKNILDSQLAESADAEPVTMKGWLYYIQFYSVFFIVHAYLKKIGMRISQTDDKDYRRWEDHAVLLTWIAVS